MSEPSSKQANPEDEDVSKEVKSDCQPALDRDGHVVRAILHVQNFSAYLTARFYRFTR